MIYSKDDLQAINIYFFRLNRLIIIKMTTQIAD